MGGESLPARGPEPGQRLPGPGQCLGALQDVAQHRLGQHPSERVLLAGVVGADEDVRTDLRLRAVAERRPGDRGCRRGAQGGEGPEGRVPADGAQRHDDRDRGEQLELADEVGATGGLLLARGLVGRGRAPDRRYDADAAQLEAITGAAAVGLAREAGRVHGTPEEVAGGIAREDPAGPVGAVRAGGQADEEDPRLLVAEAGDRAAPVGLVAVAGDLRAGLTLAPLHEARARPALADHGVEGRDCLLYTSDAADE